MHYNENGDRPQAETEVTKVYLSSKSNFQRLGRESAGLNLKRHSRPLVRVQINLNNTYFEIKKNIYLDEESIKFKNTGKTKPNQ